MRVLVLGGTAFIGRAVVAELHDAGHEVCVVHRGNHEPDDLPPVRHIHVPRMELESAGDELRDFDPDALVDNIAMTRAQVDVVLRALPADLRYVVTSSVDVYQAYGCLLEGSDTEPVPVDEDSPVRAQRYPFRGKMPGGDDYEKLDVEEAYAERQATVLRLPMVYGEHDYQRREEYVLRRVRAGRTRIPVGTGAWLSTRGYVGDVARGVRLALETDAARGRTYNLGETRTYSVGRWTRMILDAAGSDAELVRVADDRLPEDLDLTGSPSQHLLASSGRARAELGFRDTEPTQALARTVTWHLAHPPPTGDADFEADDQALAAGD